MNIGTPDVPEWLQVGCRTGRVASVDCGGAVLTGNAIAGVPVSGAGFTVSYSGGNGGVYTGQIVGSTGITGLTATLLPGNFNDGSGTLAYTLSGTPSGIGTAYFALSIGGQTCNVEYPVVPGTITMLECNNSTVTGTLVHGVLASGVSISVPYSGGDGGYYVGHTVASTGVTGLTASISAGNFAMGAGNLVYNISGTALSDGTALFNLNTGGRICAVMIQVSLPACRAKVNATTFKYFMCHNLGAANTNADPFTPSWEINGGYWQWGRKEQAAAGPSGPGSGQANEGAVNGWSNADAPEGSWADASKTANDPCPAGYRIPKKTQWDGVRSNNTLTNVGTWTNSSTNYSSGKQFGTELLLPAAGDRGKTDGALINRGYFGYYLSSTEYNYEYTWVLGFSSSGTNLSNGLNYRLAGLSVRCIAE
jgi:uncharacterized protein (TIGR02145 family)